jgi:hypothetical protein
LHWELYKHEAAAVPQASGNVSSPDLRVGQESVLLVKDSVERSFPLRIADR